MLKYWITNVKIIISYQFSNIPINWIKLFVGTHPKLQNSETPNFIVK